jgi:hypothetical protein
MDKELKEKWVKALRSKRYKQGWGRLERTERGVKKYCCLGVLAKVARVKSSDFALLTKPSGTYAFLALDVQRHLATMNDYGGKDKRGASFSEIATYIEKNL